ncbi:MAG: DUF2092 domain-containing protein [gamma proteobacterium symbiont of Taylorina sp.]|nr:DUF2092 domain-containing protein [gamma proteobacterium symbiont of Taylorina sp.]
MKKNDWFVSITTFIIILSGIIISVGAQASETQAHQILKDMGEYLKSTNQFSFRADISYESVFTGNEKIQYGATANISLLRPQYARSDYSGDERTSQIIYNGKTINYLDKIRNIYGTVESTGKIDTALDQMLKDYDLSMPVADLLYSDPYAVLSENVITGSLIGIHSCAGQRCYHLAFTQKLIDWQIWIEEGSKPLPRKMVITYKLEPGSPQFIVRLSGWNLKPALSENDFNFSPPENASEINFLTMKNKGNIL